MKAKKEVRDELVGQTAVVRSRGLRTVMVTILVGGKGSNQKSVTRHLYLVAVGKYTDRDNREYIDKGADNHLVVGKMPEQPKKTAE